MTNLPSRYDHKISEKNWQQFWQKNKIYEWEKDLPRSQTFVIDTPPPTVSGVLHMGHVFSYVQADFVARFQRMRGKTVFYPMGFDDNGLPTERLVEKVKNIRGVEMDRTDFIKECQSVVEEAEEQFEELFNGIALSVDWNEKYQTISPKSQKISQLSFIDLFNKGLAHRKFEPVLWDIVDRTALSQADLVDAEKVSFMNDIEFGIEGSLEKIVIATTRPELLPACVAVMVHPDDERYQHLIGKDAITALFEVKVPIIADELVQMEKGTGAVMCCTFGDETDILWWKKHKEKFGLPLRVILTKSGKIDKFVPHPPITETRPKIDSLLFDNGKIGSKDAVNIDHTINYLDQIVELNIKQARVKVLELLKEKNLLLNSVEIKHVTKCAERSGCPIEILVTPQWFIKIVDFKEQLKAKANECNWYPHYMKVRIEQWIDGASWDWCISRQRFFGVAFPIWYSKRAGEEGKILVADIDQLPCDPLKTLPKGYKAEEVTPETDVMDTWATSSVSPQLSSHGITSYLTADGDCERHKKLFPADLRPQAHEIIRSWAFYTIVKALHHENTIPWKNLMISGWCLAADKSKMSKSKGNVVTPNALIEEKGSDIVRYWASTSHLGADTAYSEDVLKIGGKLLNKLFNAAKFVCTNFDDLGLVSHQKSDANLRPTAAAPLCGDPLSKTKLDLNKESFCCKPQTAAIDAASGKIFEKADLWILSRIYQTIAKATADFEKFEYARAREKIEDFFWNDFCDNYLEIAKVRTYGLKAQKYENVNLSDEQKEQIIKAQQSAILTLYHSLNAVLKLFAPFIPHLCEELFQAIFKENEGIISIHQRNSWPKLENHYHDENLLNQGEIMLKIIGEVRKFKSDNNISLKTEIKSFNVATSLDLSHFAEDLKNVTNSAEILWQKSSEETPSVSAITV